MINTIIVNLLLLQSQVASSDTIAAKGDEVIASLKSMTLDDLLTKIVSGTISFGLRVLIAIAVFYVGRFLIGRIFKMARAMMVRRRIEPSLSSFLLSLLRITLMFILIIVVVGILGIETSSFVAIFASAGVAVGLALSGTLQNFAGGVLILFIKPYKIGDFIEFNGMTGTVKEIQIFNTIINTIDNRTIIIPNGGLSTGTINNFSTEMFRRVEWVVGISYGDSFDEAKKLTLEILNSDKRIVKKSCAELVTKKDKASMASEAENEMHKEPQEETNSTGGKLKFRRHKSKDVDLSRVPSGDCSPTVNLSELADSSVNIKIRAWVRTEDYWSVFFDINERIYAEFPRNGLSFPFPQLDIHMPKE